MEKKKVPQDFLRIGDYITLKFAKSNELISAEGILQEDLFLSTDLKKFDDCLFCIHLQRQYSAAKELDEFLKLNNCTNPNDIKNFSDANSKKYYQALKRGFENEETLNNTYLFNKTGKPISFGDIIQLYHVKSGKYLTVIPDQLATDERENIKVTLDKQGNCYSWLMIAPRYRIDREGDSIINSSEIYLKVAERSNEFLHCADRLNHQNDFKELNCSLEATSWKISLFRSSLDIQNTHIIMSNELIFIHDPETRCNLTIGNKNKEDVKDNENPEDNPEEQVQEFHDDSDNSVNDEETEENLNELFNYSHEHGDLIFKPSEFFTSNFLWKIETLYPLYGGPIRQKKDHVRFCHLNTKKYLQLIVLDIISSKGGVTKKKILTTTLNPSDSGTIFDLVEINSYSKFINLNKLCNILQNNFFFERGDILDDASYILKVGNDKSNALSLMINRYNNKNESILYKYSNNLNSISNQLSPNFLFSNDEPLDEYVGINCREYLLFYLNNISPIYIENNNTIWPLLTQKSINFFYLIIERLINFLQGFPISSVDITIGIDRGDIVKKKKRQLLLKDQKVIDTVLEIINRLSYITERIDKRKNDSMKNDRDLLKKRSENETSLINIGSTVLEKIFSLLYFIILDNSDNQIYVADKMPILLSHLSSQPLAGKCVSEMLNKNMELQETKIGLREIMIFVKKLRDSNMNSMYLNLLQACCSCQNKGVNSNQCKVVNLLYGDTHNVIILINKSYDEILFNINWKESSIYIPVPGQRKAAPILGENLLVEGHPSITISWTSDSINFSPLGIFGYLSVKLEEIFGIEDENDKSNYNNNNFYINNIRKDKKILTENKKFLANYFISQLYLASEMCLDRNYVALHKLEKLYPYDVLITILKMPVVNSLKAAVVRLIVCLHVDRDPQTTTRIPCLTRLWTDIKRNLEPKLPFVAQNRRYYYGLLQEIISEHIYSMEGKTWDELSRHMLKMLRKLVIFNFYGTIDRMNDVIVPLIGALDRRNLKTDGLNYLFDGNTSNKSKKVRQKSLSKNKGIIYPSPPTPTASTPTTIKLKKDTSSSNTLLDEDDDLDKSLPPKLKVKSKSIEPPHPSFLSSCFSSLKKYVHSILNIKNIIMDTTITTTKINLIRNNYNKKDSTYQIPSRYSKAPIYELDTMVEIVDILSFAQKVIEDRNISVLMRYFFLWHTEVDLRSPGELFEQVLHDSQELSLNTSEFDAVMLDSLMFDYSPLVQSSLEVLMGHHSMHKTLLENAKNVQLLSSSLREKQYKETEEMLKQLEQNAETHELWGNLRTEGDKLLSSQTIEILEELINKCKVKRVTLEFDENYMSDIELQDLYRNLGLFDIAMKLLAIVDSFKNEKVNDKDEKQKKNEKNSDRIHENTRKICKLCNILLYWFFLNNEKNQSLGYSRLEFFLNTLDDKIDSHNVIKAIFKDNETLMRNVPHSYLAHLVDKIIKNGKSHHYLTLFSIISHVKEKNIVDNQFEIVKSLTSPGRLNKISAFFVSIDHPDYLVKLKLMEPFQDVERDISLDELPPLLAYHLLLLNVLSGCTVGKLNVTTVEAKVQSVYNFNDILHAILDPKTILVCKIPLLNYFYNSFVEVELKIPGLEFTEEIWNLMRSFRTVLTEAKEVLKLAEDHGWDTENVSRQKIEYILISTSIISGFFSHYYIKTAFLPLDNPSSNSSSRNNNIKTIITIQEIDEMIIFFFQRIKEIFELNLNILSDYHQYIFHKALHVLNNLTSKGYSIVLNLKPLPKKVFLSNNKTDDNGNTVPESKSSFKLISGSLNNINSDLKLSNKEINNQSSKLSPEEFLLKRYKYFISELENSPIVKKQAELENIKFINILERLPFIDDFSVNADVRYESLISKLVNHIRENIIFINNLKKMDSRTIKTSIWIIRAFRTMIENRMGMTIYDRDELGGEAQDIAAAPVVNALNSCGVTTLCLDLIADGMDEDLQLEAIRLGVALLFKEGGAFEVQEIMNKHLSKGNSELFFKQMRQIIQQLQAWHNWQHITLSDNVQDPKVPDTVLVLRFLQLMCEGHYLPNQELIREQPNNRLSFNLLDDFVNYFNCLSRTHWKVSTSVSISLSLLILEMVQGPCENNQIHLSLNTELIETLNRINRSKPTDEFILHDELLLKKNSILIFQGLLEGQVENSVVYERVLSVIHLDIIQLMSNAHVLSLNSVVVNNKTNVTLGSRLLTESEENILEVLKTECVVLLQMLCNFKPSLYEELGIAKKLDDTNSNAAMIEVVWRGQIHRRFFHVPSVCQYLAKSSRDNLVENVDRLNAENKLIDFLNRSHEMYREVKHQQLLTELGISHIFSRENQNRATWITFFLTVLINVLLLLFYTTKNSDHLPTISKNIERIISVFIMMQSIISGFVLLLNIVVRIPVKFQSLEAAGYNGFKLLIYTAMEPMTLYYIWYLSFSILGQVVAYDFIPFLLLDIIVKNSTTSDVLNAVIVPRKQLIMGGIVILFIVQIYAFFIFMYYRHEIIDGHRFCDTFFGCYKVALGSGLRSGGGYADVFFVTVDNRFFLDITYFFIVNIGMLNLINGAIITTFGQLRENKAALLEDTINICFICNIHKQVFDRSTDKSDGFKKHIKLDHNMWNYLYFIFMLWEQDQDDDDGLEQYIRNAIKSNEINWFPLNKALSLSQTATEEESILFYLNQKKTSTQNNIISKLEKLQSEINITIEQLNQVLKLDIAKNNNSNSINSGTKSLLRSSMLNTSSLNSVSSVPNVAGILPHKPRYVQNKVLMLDILDISGIRINLDVLSGTLFALILFNDNEYIVRYNEIKHDKILFNNYEGNGVKLINEINSLDVNDTREIKIEFRLSRFNIDDHSNSISSNSIEYSDSSLLSSLISISQTICYGTFTVEDLILSQGSRIETFLYFNELSEINTKLFFLSTLSSPKISIMATLATKSSKKKKILNSNDY